MMDKRTIEARKKIARLTKNAKSEAKPTRCLWCGRETTRFCRSHSVPEFILRNIAQDGKVSYFNDFSNLPFLNEVKGKGEAGVFLLICETCDNSIFQCYEDERFLQEKPSDEMLKKIALKNILYLISKRLFELPLYDEMHKMDEHNSFPYKIKKEVASLDRRDYFWDFERIKKLIVEDADENRYSLMFWKKLNYRVPIAYQGAFTLYGDLDGDIIVDIYTKSEEIIIKDMHLCIFPLREETVCFAFYNKDDHEYDKFAIQLQKLPEGELLQFLSFLLVSRTEDMFLSPQFRHRTYYLNYARNTFINSRDTFIAHSIEEMFIKKYKQQMELKMWDKNFPNILGDKYSIISCK